MENHPIPQDITGFQFKLIGNMTVKQFIYVAIAVVLGALIGLVLIPSGIIGWPVAIIISSIGIAFAFIPIDGRPMDIMLGNLIRALISPTQYIYRKEGGNLAEAVKYNQQATTTQLSQNNSSMTVQEPQVAQIMPAPLSQPIPSPSTPLQTPTTNFAPEEKKIEEIEKKEEQIETQEETINAQLSVGENIDQSNNETDDLKKLLEETKAQKELLEKELLELKSMLNSSNAQSQVEVPESTAQTEQTQTANEANEISNAVTTSSTQERQSSAPAHDQAQAPSPNTTLPIEPNLIVGTVKDPRGNLLQNILVEVVDLEGNPVRAFKTNNLGTFASATSVANGKYKIILEDPKQEHRFDEIQIEATGAPILPLEIKSIDKREELRRELFN